MGGFTTSSDNPAKPSEMDSQNNYTVLEGYSPPEEYPDNPKLSSNHIQDIYLPPTTEQPTEEAPKEPNISQRRSKPRSSSLVAANLICVSGGMSLAWSFAFERGATHPIDFVLVHIRSCWFLAVIIGACISFQFIEKATLQLFNILASILVMINGMLFILRPENVLFASLARYSDGIAFGLTVIPAIVTGSERAEKQFRGSVLTFEQFGLVIGSLLYFPCLLDSRIFGIIALVIGTMALGLTFIYNVESPIFYLRKGNEAQAIQTICSQQKDKTVTNATQALLNENKRLLEEDIARGHHVNMSMGLVPMIKLCLFRVLVMMSFSIPIAYAWRTSYVHGDFGLAIGLVLMRLLGMIFAICTLDALGRKVVTAAYLLFSGGLLFGVGMIFTGYGSDQWSDYINKSGHMESVMLGAYQMFVGLTAPACTCYLGEAFSISVKPFFMLIAVAFENIVQIIFCCAFSAILSTESFLQYLLVVGTFQIGFAIFSFYGFPETKQTTLREALRNFTHVVDEEDRAGRI